MNYTCDKTQNKIINQAQLDFHEYDEFNKIITLFMQNCRKSHEISAPSEENSQSDHPTSYNQSKMEEKEQSKEQEEQEKLSSYFGKFQKLKNAKAESARNIAETVVDQSIRNGEIQINQEEVETKSIDKYLNKKIKTQNDSKKQIQRNLQYLKLQISQVREDEQVQMSENSTVFSRRKHKSLIRKIQREKHQLEERKKKKEEVERSREQEENSLKQKIFEEQEESEKIERRKRLIQKIEDQKIKHEKMLKINAESNKQINSLKNSAKLFEKLEQKFQSEIVIPILEEKKKKLKEIRQIKKGIDISDIKNHEIKYLKSKEKMMDSHLSKDEEQWHYKRPQRSERLAKILADEKLQNSQKLFEKKRKMQQKLRRKMEYLDYLKERSPPKIDEKKRDEIQERMQVPEKTQQRSKKQLGLNYLEEAKRLKKKKSNVEVLKKEKYTASETHTQNSHANYIYSSSLRNRDYSDFKIKRVDKLIRSETMEKMEKIKILQLEADKLTEQSKRKEQIDRLKNEHNEAETVDLLMASIKAKMGIIDIFNEY